VRAISTRSAFSMMRGMFSASHCCSSGFNISATASSRERTGAGAGCAVGASAFAGSLERAAAGVVADDAANPTAKAPSAFAPSAVVVSTLGSGPGATVVDGDGVSAGRATAGGNVEAGGVSIEIGRGGSGTLGWFAANSAGADETAEARVAANPVPFMADAEIAAPVGAGRSVPLGSELAAEASGAAETIGLAKWAPCGG
jgi:hypothetical protein